MKIHINIINGITKILEDIIIQKLPADHALKEHIQSNPKWGSKDRKIISASVYDILRNFILLQHHFQQSSIKMIVEEHLKQGSSDYIAQLSFPFEILFSIPDTINKIGTQELGKDIWEREIKAMHQIGQIFIRINEPEINKKIVIQEFTEKNIEFELKEFNTSTQQNSRIQFEYLIVKKRIDTNSLHCFKTGLCDIQDIGSQAIGHFINPENAPVIIDACCGNGGKSIHLAHLSPKSSIISMDIASNKLMRLKHRIFQQKNLKIKAVLITNEMVPSYHHIADILLLDVPCTGIGTLKRQSELKYKIDETSLNEKIAIQAQILEQYHSMLKPRGILVYSTCSLFPSENLTQINSFISSHKSYELLDYCTIYPSEHYSDGFFMAKLIKK